MSFTITDKNAKENHKTRMLISILSLDENIGGSDDLCDKLL